MTWSESVAVRYPMLTFVLRAAFSRALPMPVGERGGEPVTVPFWRLSGHGSVKVPVPRELRCWPNQFVVSPDDTVTLLRD